MAFTELAIAGAILLLVVWIVGAFNAVIKAKNRVDNTWAQIDVQLKKRYDLIPNLAAVAGALAKQEKTLFEKVAKARAEYMDAKSVAKKGEADEGTAKALSKIFAVAEAYPKMRSNEAFQKLQEELVRTEDKIAFSRQFYNDAVLSYNLLLDTIPSCFVASAMSAKKAEYFQADQQAGNSIATALEEKMK